jgi:HEAT repeat protein
MAIDPSGNFLYVTTYGSHALFGYQIKRPLGGLVPLGRTTSSMGDPETLGFTPQAGPLPDVIARAPEPQPMSAAEARFITTDETAPPLQRLRDRDYRVRIAAAYNLASRGQTTIDALPALIAALDDPNEQVVAVVVYAIGSAGPGAASAVPVLTRALEHPASVVRVQAAKALKNIRVATPEVRTSLARMATKSDRQEVAGAIEALGPIAGNSELDLLVDRLAHGNYYEERAAAKALREMGPRAAPATERLAELLFSPGLYVRRDTADILGGIGPAAGAAIPALYGALLDRDISQRAAAAIAQIRTSQVPAQ